MANSILPNQRLQRIAGANKKTIETWKEGSSLERDSSKTVSQLLGIVASDRWKFANSLNLQGKRLLAISTPAYRSAISRFYYAMYHASRACAYIEHEGDDHEAHSTLPLHLPAALSTTVNWQSKLKDARLLRNRADYESYPKSENSWKSDALAIQSDCKQLLSDAKIFLTSKGCTL